MTDIVAVPSAPTASAENAPPENVPSGVAPDGGTAALALAVAVSEESGLNVTVAAGVEPAGMVAGGNAVEAEAMLAFDGVAKAEDATLCAAKPIVDEEGEAEVKN